MAEKDHTLLILNGVEYRLALVKQNAKAGPEIAVTADEVNDQDQVEHQAIIRPASPDVDNGPVVFFKQNGKYTVLTGMSNFASNAINNGKPVKGRLLSKMALKNCKHLLPVADPVVTAIDTPVKKTYDPAFSNRPRISQDTDRNSRYASNNASRYPTAYRGNKNG